MLKKDYSNKKYHHPLKEPKNAKKSGGWGRRIVATVVAFFTLTGIAYGLFFSPWLKVERIQVKGTNDPNINTLVGKWLNLQAEEKKWYLIPKDNLLLLNKNELTEALASDIYIKSAEVNISFPDTMVVTINTRRPVLLYTIKEKYYLIDEEGQTIEQVPEEKKYLTQVPNVLGTTTNALIETTNPKLDKTLVNFIENLNNEFPKFVNVVNIIRYIITPGNPEVRVITNGSWYVLFDTSGDLNVQLTNLSRALREIIPEEELKKINYIDVRLENYIYYK